MTNDVLISANRLSKRYGHSPTYALHDLTLSLKVGEVYGFLGSNGAGKSTTIRTLLGFLQPTSGAASICGLDIVKDSVEVKRHVGYLAGEIALYKRMTGRQLLAYLAALQPSKRSDYLTQLVRRFDVELDRPLEDLSKGNRQKVGIVQAFMHEPEVLILDEPTSGLDPLMQEEFFELVGECRQRGAAVFVSSHNFSEVQRMCDRVGFIREGKLVDEQRLADLIDKAAHTFSLTFRDRAPLDKLRALPHAQVNARDEHHLTISLDGELTPLFKLLAAHHVIRLEQQEINLEEEFMQFYKKETS